MFLYSDPGYFRIFPEGLEESKQVNIRPPQSFNPLYYSLAIIGARLDHPISCGVHHLEFLCPHYVRSLASRYENPHFHPLACLPVLTEVPYATLPL